MVTQGCYNTTLGWKLSLSGTTSDSKPDARGSIPLQPVAAMLLLIAIVPVFAHTPHRLVKDDKLGIRKEELM